MKTESRKSISWKSFRGDLFLLASLYLAQFIVWRTLRAKRKEREARLKNLKLIKTTAVDDAEAVVL